MCTKSLTDHKPFAIIFTKIGVPLTEVDEIFTVCWVMEVEIVVKFAEVVLR